MSLLLDRQLLDGLSAIPEVALSGFKARQGLTGTGVSIIEGTTYFGSWRVTNDRMVWISAHRPDENFVVDTVQDAIRHTCLMILRSLHQSRIIRPTHAMAG